MNETNNTSINILINDLENSIRKVNLILGKIEFGESTTGALGLAIMSHNTNFKQALIQKNESIIELLTYLNKKLDLEPTWPVKLKNVFYFVKEIFFGVTGVNMWILAFEEIKKRRKEPANGDMIMAVFELLGALFVPAIFVGLVLSIIHVIVPLIVITSLLVPLYSVAIFKSAYNEIYGYEGNEYNKPVTEIQRRNEIRNERKEEIAKFKNLCQKYIKEYDPSNFNELNSIDNNQNLNIQTVPAENKNKDNTINNVNDQSLKKDENQQDNKERPKLASLHDSTIDKKTHASGEKNNELQ